MKSFSHTDIQGKNEWRPFAVIQIQLDGGSKLVEIHSGGSAQAHGGSAAREKGLANATVIHKNSDGYPQTLAVHGALLIDCTPNCTPNCMALLLPHTDICGGSGDGGLSIYTWQKFELGVCVHCQLLCLIENALCQSHMNTQVPCVTIMNTAAIDVLCHNHEYAADVFQRGRGWSRSCQYT